MNASSFITVGTYGKVGLIRTSGKFGHTFANSENQYETAHQDFHYLLS